MNAVAELAEENVIDDSAARWCRVLRVDAVPVAAIRREPAIVEDDVSVRFGVQRVFPYAKPAGEVVHDQIDELQVYTTRGDAGAAMEVARPGSSLPAGSRLIAAGHFKAPEPGPAAACQQRILVRRSAVDDRPLSRCLSDDDRRAGGTSKSAF